MFEIDGINGDNVDVEGLVKRTLSRESAGNWLTIVDNADSPDLFSGSTNLTRHFPFSWQGLLLFTSRNRELILQQLGVPACNVFDVDIMNENEGFKLLEKHLRKIADGQSE